MSTSTQGSSQQGAAKLAAVPAGVPVDPDLDLSRLDQQEGASRAREIPPSPRLRDLKRMQGWVDERVAEVDRRLEALNKSETKTKLAESAKKYGLEVLGEEHRILQELSMHYSRQIDEAKGEHAELNRVELMVAGDTVPNAKPNVR